MDVRTVRVVVRALVVLVLVAVLAFEERVVDVVMVRVVVAMGMLVPQPLVRVPMMMVLREVEVNADAEEHRRQDCPPASATITERPRGGRADERCEREDGSGPAGAEPTLREEVETQAQPVSGGAAREETER